MKTSIFKELQKVDLISQTHVRIIKEIKGSVKVPGVSYYSRTDTQATTTRHGSGDLRSTCGSLAVVVVGIPKHCTGVLGVRALPNMSGGYPKPRTGTRRSAVRAAGGS